MECAEYGNPCQTDRDMSGINIDTETADMKTLFELCYEQKPDMWLKKNDIIDIIKEGENVFGYYDWEKKSDQTQQLAFEALFKQLWHKEWFAGVL